jgi:N-acetylmuramic acid 6-phosphate etherase
VVAACLAARAGGALTIGVACNAGSRLLASAEIPVLLETGPEAVAGSTRLKAGTAQKAALNVFSTALMIRLGRVYEGLMVDLQATNEKLRRRSVRILERLTGKSEVAAQEALAAAGGALKLAVLILDGLPRDEAERRLAAANGFLREARRRN